MKIEKIFSDLGLRQSEMQAYLALLELGPSSVAGLAKWMGVSRTTLYGHLAALEKTRLVVNTELDEAAVWQAESPSILKNLIKEKIVSWQNQSSVLEDLLPTLMQQHKTDVLAPRFSRIESVAGLKRMLDDMLSYRNIETHAFWPIAAMTDILSDEYLYRHNVERIRRGISVRAIWPPKRIVDTHEKPFLGVGQRFLREIREAPSSVDTTMGYWMYQNKVAFISSRAESFGFIVESVELTSMLKTQFEFIWQASKPIEANSAATDDFIKQNFSKNYANKKD